MSRFKAITADKTHLQYASEICELLENASKVKGTGISKRTTDYITAKILDNKAVIALDEDGSLAGFCYIESWQNHDYVANSGLIVSPNYRKQGLAKLIKKRAFEHSRETFPNAKIFGLTTSLAVMKINSDLGYRPVTFSELTEDEDFWAGCDSCENKDILDRTHRKNCLCTGMLCVPESFTAPVETVTVKKNRWKTFKKFIEKTLPKNLKTYPVQKSWKKSS